MMKPWMYITAIFLIANFALEGQNFDDFSCEIHKVFPPLSIERSTLTDASTVQDIHRQYKPAWVKKFISVEIHTVHQGNTKVARSQDDKLTLEQMENIKSSDVNTDIYLKINYIPNNNLKRNDAKVYDATFRINPDVDAKYVAGEDAMQQFLKDKVFNKISPDIFRQYGLAAVKFTIDESGLVDNVHILESSGSEDADGLMKEAICNMPTWLPAKYQNDIQVAQDFVLTLGSMQSCIVPTLNIKRY